jgi:hypothetical protein
MNVRSLGAAAGLRADIGSGKAGDRTGSPDSAAASLCADAGALRARPTGEEVRTARAREVRQRPAGSAAAGALKPRAGGSFRSKRRAWIAILTILSLALIGFLLLRAVAR